MKPRGRPWVGIGAQRSGTTWLVDMMLQHPDLALAGSRKELHAFDAALVTGWTDAEAAGYRRLFDRADGRAAGDFTPSYMRNPWVPPLLARSASPGTRLVAVLRDPVARFESAMRWYSTRPRAPGRADPGFREWVRLSATDAIWGGMYAAQLDAWLDSFNREDILVLIYEDLVAEPSRELSRVFHHLEVDPVEPVGVDRPSATTATDQFPLHIDRNALRALYRRENDRLEQDWGVNGAAWR